MPSQFTKRNYVLYAGLILSLSMSSLQAISQALPVASSTQAMLGRGDIADDPTIWLNNADLSKSIVFGVNKSSSVNGGVYAFNLDGSSAIDDRAWIEGTNLFEKGERYNNIDLKYNFSAGEESWDIISVSNRSDQEIDVFRVISADDGSFLELEKVGEIELGSGFIDDGDSPYGLGMYHSKRLNKHFVLISDKVGQVAQYELSFNPTGSGESQVLGQRVAGPINVSGNATEVEGIVADDYRDVIYIAAEDEGIYRYATNSQGILTNKRINVALISEKDYLTADVEGMTMYYAGPDDGYLIASVQGISEYAIFDRSYLDNAPNAYIKNFSIQGVENTDGLDVINLGLGDTFSNGLLVVHDGVGDNPSNYKYVDWLEVSQAGNINLDNNNTYNIKLSRDSEQTPSLNGIYRLKNAEFDAWLDGDDFFVVDINANGRGESKKWQLVHVENNDYRIKNIGFNQWLYKNDAVGVVMMSEEQNILGSIWTLTQQDNGNYIIENQAFGQFLDADDDFSVGLSNNPKLDDEWLLNIR